MNTIDAHPMRIQFDSLRMHIGSTSQRASCESAFSHSLKEAYDDVRQKLDEAHKKNKQCMTKVSRVVSHHWRQSLAVHSCSETRKNKKIVITTIIDRVGDLDYYIQLIGSSKTLVVHRNRLKLWYGEPVHFRLHKRNPQQKVVSTQNQQSPPKSSYADVVSNCSTTVGGYTCSSEELLRPEPQPAQQEQATTTWPQRNRRPPAQYGDLISH